MENYKKSNEYKVLEKLADLEKRLEAYNLKAKDSNGEIGLSSIDKNTVPAPIKRIIIIKKSMPIPLHVMNSAIDDDFDVLLSHMSRHKIMPTPGEALYMALGKKDPFIFDAIKDITIGDILRMARNKAAVAATTCPSPMRLDEFDIPKYIKIMSELRGFAPDELRKEASDSNKFSSSVEKIKFEFSNGNETELSKKYVKRNADDIQRLIDDGAIIRVVQILNSGREHTVYYNPGINAEDSVYLELLKKHVDR